ncbi:MAG TPA: ABC transporter ATP-binding protein [Phycisphaerae bacterium]|nr:ABC transporter ATP-binding protein [Phycisphaerae bacterium]HRY67990.1 ABC transporter ATP-binding protein [Phycisphaerae bacterium]HSA26727.1 ABC transporter ATP-binding protein [Phycisphaerae bacterium]
MIEVADNVALRAEDVHKSYLEGTRMVEVLKNVTLNVRRGELTLLAGPSGSGKTTLLTIMGLLLKPTSGKIVLLGRDVTALGEAALPAIRRRHIGFIFQGFNLLSSLNALQNVEIALGLQGVTGSRARKQAMELLEHVGLEHRWRHRPAAMSGGEKQRVAVARALASPAELVLADEPTGNLDSNTGSQVITTLQQLAHEQNRAVLVVTHDQSLFTLADRIVRLRDGQILDDELVYSGASAKMPA